MTVSANLAIRRWRLLAWSLVCALLVTGMLAPMFTFTSFYFFDDTFSLARGIFHLLDEGEPLLFIIVFSFSMLMPAYKMFLLYRLITIISEDTGERLQRDLARLGLISKWSMLDVFVLAVLVVTVKLGAIATIEIHYGLYLFSVAVILSMLLTQWVQSTAAKRYEQSSA